MLFVWMGRRAKPKERLYFLFLQENSARKLAPCGCFLEHSDDDYPREATFRYCTLHSFGADMHQALVRIAGLQDTDPSAAKIAADVLGKIEEVRLLMQEYREEVARRAERKRRREEKERH